MSEHGYAKPAHARIMVTGASGHDQSVRKRLKDFPCTHVREHLGPCEIVVEHRVEMCGRSTTITTSRRVA